MSEPLPEGYVEDEPQEYLGAAVPLEPILVQNVTERRTPELCSTMTWPVGTAGTGQPVQILQRTERRFKAKITINSLTGPLTTVNTPAVPASTVAQYNNNNQTVAVTVTGGTVSAIAVNGVTTGLTSGTVFVPANGTITLTYTVAPVWAWAGTQSSPGVMVFSQLIDRVQGAVPQGATYSPTVMPFSLPDWESVQPLYVICTSGTGTVSVQDERFL
jgi:hypothetical protein